MAIDAVAMEYPKRLAELEAALANARSGQSAAVLVVAAAALLFMALGFLAVSRRTVPLWYPPLSLPVAAVSIRKYLRNRAAALRFSRLAGWYRQGVARLQGSWAGNGVSGEEFSDANHVFERDLNLFGTGSLFELLCTTRTEMGRRRLASWLLAAPPLNETLARQEAIQELTARTSLREEVALLGKFQFEGANWETFEQWLESPAAPFRASARLLALLTSISLGILLLAGFDRALPWDGLLPWMAALGGFHAVYGLVRREQTRAAIESLRLVGSEIGVFRRGLDLMGRQTFRSPMLNGLVRRVGHGGAALCVRKLERLIRMLEQRNKEWFFLPSTVLLFATQVCMAVEHWRQKHRASLADWLDAWAEFEALNALAAYAYEHPENTYPQFTPGRARFEGDALGHPLLPWNACVPNDVRLNDATRFYIVSGSNMSGKSTLLRAIGVNAVLALAGAPVRARSLRLSHFAICASISVGDSLLNGKSKFLAEVERMRQTIELAQGDRPVLFLIDEIFSGTNSRDRRVVAESVVRALTGYGAVGALSTHDLALTGMVEGTELRGCNVHMGCRDAGGPLDFDYLLKPGVTRESNALDIARMVGIPV
jgi:hypothetical protein